jgi:hypothetical protein
MRPAGAAAAEDEVVDAAALSEDEPDALVLDAPAADVDELLPQALSANNAPANAAMAGIERVVRRIMGSPGMSRPPRQAAGECAANGER